jgi:hypothetical protein
MQLYIGVYRTGAPYPNSFGYPKIQKRIKEKKESAIHASASNQPKSLTQVGGSQGAHICVVGVGLAQAA